MHVRTQRSSVSIRSRSLVFAAAFMAGFLARASAAELVPSLDCDDTRCIGILTRSEGASVGASDYVTVSRKPYRCVEGSVDAAECVRARRKIIPLCNADDDSGIVDKKTRYLFNGTAALPTPLTSSKISRAVRYAG